MFIPEGLRQTTTSFARCQGKAEIQTRANFLEQITKIIVFLLFFFAISRTVHAVVWGSIFGIVSALICLKSCWKNYELVPRKYSRKTETKLIKFGIPLVGVPVVNYLLSTSDQFIINLYCGEYNTGIYAMGYKISHAIFSLVTTFLITATHHIIMQKYDVNGKKDAEAFVKDLSLMYWIICIPFLICTFYYSKYILLLLASDNYLESNVVLSISSLGMVFCGYVSYTNKPWELSGKSWIIFLISGIGALSNVVLNIIFVPVFGYNAAAVTTVVSYLIVIIISGFWGRKTLSVWIASRDIVLLLFAAAGATASTSLLNIILPEGWIYCCLGALTTILSYSMLIFITFKKGIKTIVKNFSNIKDE